MDDPPPAYSSVVPNDWRRPLKTFYGIGSHDDNIEAAAATATTPFISQPQVNTTNPTSIPGFHGLPESIKFSSTRSFGTSSQEYSFDVRDDSDCLAIKGTVQGNEGAVILRNLSGIQFLSITPKFGTPSEPGAGADYVGSLSFEVMSLASVLGEIQVLGNSRDFTGTTHTTVNLKGQSQNYSVHSVSVGDIAISRSEEGSPPICVIHMNSPTTSKSFDGSLRFLGICLPRVSEIEQCLCLSVAITYVVARNRKKGVHVEEIAAAEREPCEQLLNCGRVIIVIFLFWFVFWGIFKVVGIVHCSGKSSMAKGCS